MAAWPNSVPPMPSSWKPANRQAARSLVGLLLLGLAACAPIQAAPPATPQVITLTYTPALDAWRQAVGRCALKIPGVGLVVNQVAANQPALSQADLSLRLDPAADPALPFRSALGADEIAVIVPADNPLAGPINLADLEVIFGGKQAGWSDWLKARGTALPAPLQVWSYPQGDDLRDRFYQAIQPGTAAAPPNPPGLWTAPDPAAMVEAVGQNPGAVGFVLKSSLARGSEKVRALPLDAAAQAALRLTVTAAMAVEPQGLLRQLVLCAQTPANP